MEDDSSTYVMGRSAGEAHRLQLQSRLYATHTDHLLTMAGIKRGMRVLDVGCGTGDVTLQAAGIVGPTGFALGIDSDPSVLGVAERRAVESGVANVAFRQGDIPDVELDELVDAVIGRLILIHLDEPVEAVRALSRLVRPGGVITFQDVNTTRARTVPEAPLASRCLGWGSEALRAAGREPDAGDRLVAIFRQSGFREPRLAVSVPASADPESPAYAYVAQSIASLLPALEKNGITTREEAGIETLTERLRAEALRTGSVLYLSELVGAWVRT